MREVQRIETNGATEMVVLSRVEYERLIDRLEDAEDIATAKDYEAAKSQGEFELLPWEMAKRLRRGEHPVGLWREHRGLTQKALAAQVKMTAAQLSEIENGKKTGSVATLQKLARALGVTIDELVPVGAF